MQHQLVKADQRALPRLRVLMRATLYSPDGAFAVRVRDLSLAGVRVVAQVLPSASCDSILKFGSVFIAARLVWVDGKEGGLRFYRNLSETELQSAFQPVAGAD